MSSTTKKALAVLVLVILCFIPTLFVMGVVSERRALHEEVKKTIGNEWGSPQEFYGPVVILPYRKSEVVEGRTVDLDRYLYIFPDVESMSVTLDPAVKKRGLFHVRVYGSAITGKATFTIPSPETLSTYGNRFDFANAVLSFPMSDVRSIDPGSVVSIDGAPAQLLQGSGISGGATGLTQGIHIAMRGLSKKTFETSFTLGVSGSESFSFLPAGTATVVDATSSWPSPSFKGAYLPTLSEVTNTGFTASWRVSGLGRAFPAVVAADSYFQDTLRGSMITIALFDGIDQYTLTTRAIKYAILFIALTFMGFFFVEVLGRLRVHPIQYALIGAALALFYLLLLSLSEQIIFSLAYGIAAGLTTLLIAAYSYYVLHARRHAVIVGGLLAILYAYLYFVLLSEDYALIAGTLLLFGILSVTMYLTRKVDWYGFDKNEK